MVTVVRIITRNSNIAAEDGLIHLDIAGIGIRLAKACITTLNNHAIF